jgi:UDP-N-acetyl-D-glucosamine/UDP-N-acetyl-D-galactosamine dehydrogenase
VLQAAGTKWNFLKFTPGLVGGHCIGVDPYYLTHRAQRAGYNPQVILSGRAVNDSMGPWVARECIKHLLRNDLGRTVTVLGITFKENVPDIRNSKVIDVVRELEAFGIDVQVSDPFADPEECRHEYGLSLVPAAELRPSDAVILAVSHEHFLADAWAGMTSKLKDGRGLVIDIKSVLPRDGLPQGVNLWRL